MMVLYRLVTFLAGVVIWPYGRIKASQGSKVWQGRLGQVDDLEPRDIWIHAASVGEVKVVGILIKHLLRRNESLKLHLTVMTRSGYKTATDLFNGRVTVSFFPLDTRAIVSRTLDAISPKIIVVAETEIWPNLIVQAESRGIPVVLINGRMSENSFGKYRMFRGALSNLIARYDRFFFKTDEDRDRYSYFGASAEKSEVLGDMKFDAPLLTRSAGHLSEIRERAGVSEGEFLFVAGSTRPGEEEILLRVYRDLKSKYPELRLLLAPRHLDRLDEVFELMNREGLQYHVWDQSASIDSESVAVVDQMGLLEDLYCAADLAFVGGTMVDIGGHNILEPVWAGTPVLFGSSLDNVREAAEYILNDNYGAIAETEDQLRRLTEEAIMSRDRFAIKKDNESDDSPAARVSDYILKRCNYA